MCLQHTHYLILTTTILGRYYYFYSLRHREIKLLAQGYQLETGFKPMWSGSPAHALNYHTFWFLMY